MQWRYREEAINLKQQAEKTVEQLINRLTNILLKGGYPWDQMDTRKVKVMFSTTKYFERKCYKREQPLTHTHQVLLDKSKTHERLLTYYKKIPAIHSYIGTIAAFKTRSNRSHCPNYSVPNHVYLTLTIFNKMRRRRPMINVFLSIS